MKDRRSVDDLPTQELERILLIKRREARLARLRQVDRLDQVAGRDPLESSHPPPVRPPVPTAHRQFEGVGASASYRSVEVEEERWKYLKRRLVHWLAAPVHIKWRFVLNGILLLVEAAAVVGLVVIVVGTWQSKEKIDIAPTEEPIVLPTPTAAPTISAVVLPGGHTPPDAGGFSQPESIPEHLQALAQTITPQPVPAPGPEHAKRIVIPSIDVDHPVVPGDDWEALKRGVGHSLWSANPGEVGNCVLSAYNDIYGEIFRRLPELALGDPIIVHSSTQVYRYVVRATHIAGPTQVELMNPTDHPVLTLISSYPYLVDDKRIVVIAELESP